MSRSRKLTRRRFVQGIAASAAAPALFHIVPRHCVAQSTEVPPSEKLGGALIGAGGRGGGTFGELRKDMPKVLGKECELRATCDVKYVGSSDDLKRYTDFRKLLERKDIDFIAIGTPPHWHALISIAAMEAGKHVLCEKPMSRTIAEGRAVVDAAKRYGRIFQIGTFGRFGASRDKNNITTHKLMRSGLFKDKCPAVVINSGGKKIREWAGRPYLPISDPPKSLDWDLYCGPSPLKPFVGERHGGSHRKYWDYDGGGLSDMGQHHLDPLQWIWGKDDTSPVEIEAYAPAPHHECTGVWAWCEMKYADGMTLVIDSAEWGPRYDKQKSRGISVSDLSPEDQEKFKLIPDPEPLLSFAEAVKTRKQAGGGPEPAHRASTLLHLCNIAFRCQRPLKYDPVKEIFIGDEQATRLVYQPLRAPFHV